MDLKLKIKEIYELIGGFNELVQKEMPIPLALKIKRNANKINDELRIINEMKKDVIEKHNTKTKEGHSRMLEEIDELDTQEIDIDLQLIYTSELNSSDISVKPAVLVNLDPIIKDDTDEESV